MRTLLQFIGVSGRRVTGHSFRAGGASFLKNLGFSEALIKLKGRWTSSAYKEYINTKITYAQQTLPLYIHGRTKFRQMLNKLDDDIHSKPDASFKDNQVHKIEHCAFTPTLCGKPSDAIMLKRSASTSLDQPIKHFKPCTALPTCTVMSSQLAKEK